jgi:TonB family protein
MNSLKGGILFLLTLLLAGCSNNPEQLKLKDDLGIDKSLSDIFKKEYGLYVSKGAKLSSASDFANYTFVLIGETEPDFDIRIAAIGMSKTNRFLFRNIECVSVSDNMSNADKTKPCFELNENVTAENGNSISRAKMFYSKGASYNEIIESYLSNGKKNCVFLLKRVFAKGVAGNLNEIVLEKSGIAGPAIQNSDKEITGEKKLKDSIDNLPPSSDKSIDESAEIYQFVEEMPSYPGGDESMLSFIAQNIKYPQTAMENGISGKVIVQFVVYSNGSIGQIKVLRSIEESLDNEAIRVVKLFPKFTPGKHNGKAVNVYYVLPVKFDL